MKNHWFQRLVLPSFAAAAGAMLCLPPCAAAQTLQPGKEKTRPEPEYRPYDFLLSTDQSIEFYQERVKRDPQDGASFTLLGQMYIRKARETGDFSLYDRAETAIRRALQLDRDSLAAQINQALILCARHKFSEGLQLALQICKEHPAEPQLLLVVGDAHLELGNYAEAEKAYQHLQQRDRLAFLWTRQARLAELRGDVASALRLMQRAADEEQRARISREGGAWYQVRLGDLQFGRGHLEEAANHYQSALKTLPRSAPALAGLAQVRAGQGKYPEAIDLYKRAIQVNPDCFMLAALGDLYVKIGNQALAQILYAKLDQTAALKQQAYNRELSLYYANHDRNLDQSVELARNDLEVRKDIYAYDTLAWALCKNKRFPEAAKAMTEALKLGTRDASLYYHAGKIYEGLGDKQKARANLEQALAINPYFSPVHAEDAKRSLTALE